MYFKIFYRGRAAKDPARRRSTPVNTGSKPWGGGRFPLPEPAETRPPPSRSSKDPPDQMHRHAQRHSDAGRQSDSQGGPLPAPGLPPDGEAGSAAGEVEEGEEQGAQGGSGSPAVADQKPMELGEAPVVRQRPGGEIPHQDAGHHDLVGREPQQERQQNDAVQPHKAPQRLQKARQTQQHALPAHGDVGSNPDQQSRRGGHRHRPAQNEQGPVQDGAHQHLPHLGHPVGGQLQGEGGGLPLQHRPGEEPAGPQRHGHRQHHRAHEQDRRGGGPPQAAPGCEEHRDEGDEGGEAAVAGDECVGEDGDEPFPGALDDPAPHDAAGVAPQAHAHEERKIRYFFLPHRYTR